VSRACTPWTDTKSARIEAIGGEIWRNCDSTCKGDFWVYTRLHAGNGSWDYLCCGDR
jgi:hypothetical protein